jgi:hypothetical protein
MVIVPASIVVFAASALITQLYTGDLYMKGFDFSTIYCTLVVNKHFSLHLMFGKSCRAVGEEMSVGRTQIMYILKRKCEILDVLKTMLPVQRRVTGNCTFVY